MIPDYLPPREAHKGESSLEAARPLSRQSTGPTLDCPTTYLLVESKEEGPALNYPTSLMVECGSKETSLVFLDY